MQSVWHMRGNEAMFDDGRTVDAGSTLITPEISGDEWCDFNMAIRGIRLADVRAADAFPLAWRALVKRAAGWPHGHPIGGRNGVGSVGRFTSCLIGHAPPTSARARVLADEVGQRQNLN
jgi:hypothetical protein